MIYIFGFLKYLYAFFLFYGIWKESGAFNFRTLVLLKFKYEKQSVIPKNQIIWFNNNNDKSNNNNDDEDDNKKILRSYFNNVQRASTLSHKMCPRKQTTEPKLLILVSFLSREVTSYTDTSYCIHTLLEVCCSIFYGPPCIWHSNLRCTVYTLLFYFFLFSKCFPGTPADRIDKYFLWRVQFCHMHGRMTWKCMMLTLLNGVTLRTRRALLLYKVYGDSTLLDLKGTLFNSNNALLVLSRRYYSM